MRMTYPVLLIIVIAIMGTVSAGPAGGDVGYYDITSTPAGATVMVDGAQIGITPATASVPVAGAAGHTIIISKPGYETWSLYYTGNPPAGQYITVNANLVPIQETYHPEMGFYRVNSDPSGGSVLLDGKDYGLTPVTISILSTGTPGHTITVSRSGYQTWSRFYPANPGPDQRIDVYATLIPANQTGDTPVKPPLAATTVIPVNSPPATTIIPVNSPPATTTAIPPVQPTAKAPLSLVPVVMALSLAGLLTAVVRRK